jgi:S1-C subfamily serine protease
LALDASAIIGGMTYTGLIRSDIPLQAGYSGGPLLDPRGEIIGVHTAYEPAGVSGWSTLVNRDIIRELQNGKQ